MAHSLFRFMHYCQRGDALERANPLEGGRDTSPGIVREDARINWQPWCLAVLAATIYFTRLDSVPFRGEETRWARVAWEMRETGDYIVPRQQGQVFADRPPLNSWCMLLASTVTGGLDRVPVRLPAALATFLTVLLVYAYSRQFITRAGALAAGLAYATFPQTLQLGRFAESDALFTLLVTGSLMAWHTGYVRGWPKAWTWAAGYALAALAGLAKGPQGPVYFAASVSLYLALRRDWRYLFCGSHAFGLATFLIVLGAWQIPFSIRSGTGATLAVWSEEGTLSNRFLGFFGPAWWRHLVGYPVEVFAYLLPWSLFLFPLARRGTWRSMRESEESPLARLAETGQRLKEGDVLSSSPHGIRSPILFLLTFVAVALPTCWLVTEARPRHLMAIYPSVACVIAAVIDRHCFASEASRRDEGLRLFLLLAGLAAALLGVGVTIASLFWPTLLAKVLSPSWTTIVCGVAIVGLAAIAIRARREAGSLRLQSGLLAVAAMLGLGFVSVGIDHLARIADDPRPEITRLKTVVLDGRPLVSFGTLFHKFTFYYQDKIEVLPWPEAAPSSPFFCFMDGEKRRHGKLPFAWEEVATIDCDRSKPKSINVVHVGRVIGQDKNVGLVERGKSH